VAAPDIPPDVEPADDEAAQLGKVTVTGSHIRRAQIEGPQPVEVVTPEMIRQVGGVKLGDFIPYLPMNQGQTRQFANSDGPAGDAFFNLRGLGEEATLTLVNGHRVATYGGFGADTFVNVNAIPLAAIERVEILKDGASAIYGADAIAGVVNVILKRDYEGLELSASYSDTEGGGGSESSVDMVAGHTFDDTNITAVLSWYELDPLYARDREVMANLDQRWRGGYDSRSMLSSPPTVFLLGDSTLTTDPACPPEQRRFNADWGSDVCTFNYSAYAIEMAGGERWAGQLFLTHSINPSLTLRTELDYADDTGRRLLAPEPWPWSFVPADHPDNPFGQDLLIAYRATFGPDRRWHSDTIDRRALVELDGLAGAWAWNAHLQWSDSKTDNSETTGVSDPARREAALTGEGGPSGDQWYNPFGLESTNDPALVDWIFVGQPATSSRVRVRTAGFVANGPLLEIGSGVVDVAVGAEYRTQEHWLAQDPTFFVEDTLGADAGIASRQIRSIFAEFSVPLPGSLEMQLAGRYEDYSDFGGHFSPKVAFAWRPADTFLARASYAESFRAPAFQDLYAPSFEGEAFVEDRIRCPVTGAGSDCWTSVAEYFSGNPGLDPETGKSWYAGAVWSPEGLRGLDIQLDFWKFKWDERVEWIGGDFAVENFPLDPRWVKRADPTPEDIDLGIPGRIEYIYSRPINIGGIETRGIDLALRYAWTVDAVGSFSGQLMATYVDDYRVKDPTLTEWESNGKDVAGKSEWGPGGMPRWKSVASLVWDRGANSASATVRFTSAFEDYLNWPAEDGSESDRPHRVGSWTTIDLQYTRSFRSLGDGRLSIGCTNCADRDPPLVLDGLGFDEVVHNVYGRGWYAQWSQPFGGLGN